MNTRIDKYRGYGLRFANCERKEQELVVRGGLSYTPADMAKLTERGMPINSFNTSTVFYDGEENPSFHVTSDRERYADVCDLWEEHMTIRDKARKAAKTRKSKT